LKTSFWKLSGAGNDFVTFDNRLEFIPESAKPELGRNLCRRGLSVGADGLMLLENSDRAHIRMRVFNGDGSEAETCGNASRCIALLALTIGAAPPDMSIETGAGIYRAEVTGNRVCISMTEPHDLRLDIPLSDPDIPAPVIHFVNTGVPHAVVFVDDVENLDITTLGRRLRHHHLFRPAGANINFVQIVDNSRMIIRTYERGVEEETLACGTGCAAAAIIAGTLGEARNPVQLKTRGGFINTIHFSILDSSITDLKLEGEARIVFRGEIELEL